MMNKMKIYLLILVGTMFASCALMKDLDDAYASKDIQNGIKEIGSYVDTLKFQKEDHYTYRILAANAQDMIPLCENLSRKAMDSYFRKVVNQMAEQAEVLHSAAARKSPVATKAAIDEILRSWAIIEEYKKPG